MDQSEAKRRAAEAALAWLPEREGVIGLGSGSTAALFIALVGARVAAGARYTGVPTSEASRRQALALGIPLLDDAGPWDIDVCVDGADEVSDALDLIKGGGGCHTREKIVNFAARRNVIVVDASKRSARLGEKWPVPVEVLPFGRLATVAKLGAFGKVTLRLKDGEPWLTDAGNRIYDVAMGPLDDPRAADEQLRRIPGVVETGLFAGRADVVLVAGGDGVRTIERARR